MKLKPLVFSLARCLSVLCLLHFTLEAPCATFTDVVYGAVGGRDLHLDLCQPVNATSGPWPLVIYIHGGAWLSGDYHQFSGYLKPLLNNGIAVASVEYRLASQAGKFGAEPVTFPAQIHDVKGAVRFLRANAVQYNLDPNRFGCWGDSAGGHLAALLGTSGGVAELEGAVGGNLKVSSRVQAVVDFFGPTDLLHAEDDVTSPPGCVLPLDEPESPIAKLIGFDKPGEGVGVLKANKDNPKAPYPAMLHRLEMANPITHVTPDDPPFFIGHGTKDILVPLAQSYKLHTALIGKQVPSIFKTVIGAGHSMPPAVGAQAVQFLIEKLKPRVPSAGAVQPSKPSAAGTP
ncbi:MAG: alpha/beta hydrolase [Candidatus Sumerlaeota bacterium]|nr:alpha/beta hydrolase [Candidatus Sumerlaeota bacterium]